MNYLKLWVYIEKHSSDIKLYIKINVRTFVTEITLHCIALFLYWKCIAISCYVRKNYFRNERPNIYFDIEFKKTVELAIFKFYVCPLFCESKAQTFLEDWNILKWGIPRKGALGSGNKTHFQTLIVLKISQKIIKNKSNI
jgi:hypothetical protein